VIRQPIRTRMKAATAVTAASLSVISVLAGSTAAVAAAPAHHGDDPSYHKQWHPHGGHWWHGRKRGKPVLKVWSGMTRVQVTATGASQYPLTCPTGYQPIAVSVDPGSPSLSNPALTVLVGPLSYNGGQPTVTLTASDGASLPSGGVAVYLDVLCLGIGHAPGGGSNGGGGGGSGGGGNTSGGGT